MLPLLLQVSLLSSPTPLVAPSSPSLWVSLLLGGWGGKRGEGGWSLASVPITPSVWGAGIFLTPRGNFHWWNFYLCNSYWRLAGLASL